MTIAQSEGTRPDICAPGNLGQGFLLLSSCLISTLQSANIAAGVFKRLETGGMGGRVNRSKKKNIKSNRVDL